MVVNDNAFIRDERVVLRFIASKLAPTGLRAALCE
ncbi:hypothetical protein PS893_01466 [Pseudomonas fluorescens]|jgi:hypothetical protein|uniref:Uncharacterized protein n=1 Tax=Pseudomonas fluorescens TaxID=294 RepID=A0A5E6TF42_PSEFL|nr:hypothetical protein PS647_02824 [Pseudomonas fluorescens]VVN18167.1 hypothetical protein PS673_04157 [Pseudomonas fluorescens]VVO74406.1 hypothetical protein PS893_01466 [Pseudomonas fluorescens]VVO84851.1 hypothetical protein PS843_01983 [Pseudomonas fluorescens]